PGTHLLKNIKALAFAGAAFDDVRSQRWRSRAGALLGRGLPRQGYADGAHVGPSTGYHNVALEDVLDLLNLTTRAPLASTPVLQDHARRMVDFAAAVQTPSGDAPSLGDGGADAAPPTVELLEYASRLGVARPRSRDGVRWFPDAAI